MSTRPNNLAKIGASTVLAIIAYRMRRNDPVHAPGHRHRKPAPDDTMPQSPDISKRRDQPWIRRSHSDSQQRRFRR